MVVRLEYSLPEPLCSQPPSGHLHGGLTEQGPSAHVKTLSCARRKKVESHDLVAGFRDTSKTRPRSCEMRTLSALRKIGLLYKINPLTGYI